jgi:hypothetical protein
MTHASVFAAEMVAAFNQAQLGRETGPIRRSGSARWLRVAPLPRRRTFPRFTLPTPRPA